MHHFFIDWHILFGNCIKYEEVDGNTICFFFILEKCIYLINRHFSRKSDSFNYSFYNIRKKINAISS